MAARILDGRALATELRANIAARSAALVARGVVPRLVVAIVGDDGASRAYAQSLVKAGATVGVETVVDELPAEQRALCVRLAALGADPAVHGIILQQPLPRHLELRAIAPAIPETKDVDCTNPISQGRLAFAGSGAFVPATPAAIMLLLERSSRSALRGVRACVVGRSGVVGLPAALLLMRADATVTIAHSKTADLARHTRDAEVLVVATGAPGTVTAEMVSPDATVIDAGTTYVDGKPRGDVDPAAAEVARELTPVPGGVGPVTTVALMRNVVEAAEKLSAV
jgi:methylenetetrahydrofolate dehydrogenase (NADP+)/methenyltetrahydrofolate cyclohydrolase